MIKKYIRKAIENALLSTMDCYNLEIIKKRTAHKIKDDYEKVDWGEIVECETCGCLLRKSTVTKGKSIIKLTKNDATDDSLGVTPREYIHTPYYCKVHAPQEKICGVDVGDRYKGVKPKTKEEVRKIFDKVSGIYRMFISGDDVKKSIEVELNNIMNMLIPKKRSKNEMY